MTDNKKPLNLDELFGQARSVKVIHEGREYELLKLDAIGPMQLLRFQKLQNKAYVLQSAGEDMTDEQAKEVGAMFDEMLSILCEDLPPASLTFVKKVRIITYYIEETQGKKTLETALRRATGAKSSRV